MAIQNKLCRRIITNPPCRIKPVTHRIQMGHFVSLRHDRRDPSSAPAVPLAPPARAVRHPPLSQMPRCHVGPARPEPSANPPPCEAPPGLWAIWGPICKIAVEGVEKTSATFCKPNEKTVSRKDQHKNHHSVPSKTIINHQEPP